MTVYSKTRKSHYWNEDRFINGKDYSVVLDGATPLKSTNTFNEACWMVNYIKKHFTRYRGDIKFKLTNLCNDAYKELSLQCKNAEYLPSASAAWVEFNDGVANIGILGDCEVTAIKNNGEIIRFYDNRLTKLDDIAIKELIEIARQKNIHICEAKKYIQATLIKHRKLANTPNGYSALSISPNTIINEKTFSIRTDNLKSIYIYSDGFSQAFESLNIYPNHNEMFKSIKSIDDVINKIVNTSFKDKKLDLFPRFKIIDDITVTQIDF